MKVSRVRKFAATCSRLLALGELLSVTDACFRFLGIIAGVACVGFADADAAVIG